MVCHRESTEPTVNYNNVPTKAKRTLSFDVGLSGRSALSPIIGKTDQLFKYGFEKIFSFPMTAAVSRQQGYSHPFNILEEKRLGGRLLPSVIRPRRGISGRHRFQLPGPI
jgi:hypothetical protein